MNTKHTGKAKTLSSKCHQTTSKIQMEYLDEDQEIQMTSFYQGKEHTQFPTISEQSTIYKSTIFHAPAHNRYGRGSDFEPKLVSIGPYYHGRSNLKHMEQLKRLCMSYLMEMRPAGGSNTDHVSMKAIPLVQTLGGSNLDNVPIRRSKSDLLMQPHGGSNFDNVPIRRCMSDPLRPPLGDDVLVDEFICFETYARSFYKEKFYHSGVDFVRMLVLDSCFIIRIILCLSLIEQESMPFIDSNIKEVRSDLLLLENQIPLFFLKEVYHWFLHFLDLDRTKFPPFETLLESFICLDMPWRINPHGLYNGAAHLLDLYWRCTMSIKLNKQLNIRKHQFPPPQIDVTTIGPKVIANATVLHEMADINFEKCNGENHVGLDVTFSNGILRMPCLKIDSSRTILLVNLMAFESSMLREMRTVTSYLKLMDALIDSEKDVELLQQCDVMYNTLSNHKMAAIFFNDIGNFCHFHDNKDPFSHLYANIQKYYSSSWNRQRASLRHKYFSSPWAAISVVAGATLLILSVVQTGYTIYDHYHQKN